MVGRLGAGLALGLAALGLAACSDPDDPKGAGGQGASGGGSGGAGVGGGGGGSANVGGSAGSGGAPHVPPMRLADDASGITGLEDCALAHAGVCVKPLERSHQEVCGRWQADRPQKAAVVQTTVASECNPGVTDPTAIEDALRRLNLYRWLGGVPPLALDPEWSDYARACAIIQARIAPEISHFPETTAPCFTEKGYTASGQSQLSTGRETAALAIDSLIYDTGDNNFHILGHRQGMLMPWTTKVGIGFAGPVDASPSTCVRTFDGTGIARPPGIDAVYTFPSPGYQPWELVARSTYQHPAGPLEWSITLPLDTDASAAQVRLVRLRGSTWEQVPITAGPLADEKRFGLWVNVPPAPLEPGTYAMIVSGTALGTFGYQMRLEQCTEVPLACDVLAQGCGEGIGCYDAAAPFCRKSAGGTVGSACTLWDNGECAPGLDCAYDGISGSGYSCARFCDLQNPNSDKACAKLCPSGTVEIYADELLEPIGARCLAGFGAGCNPLAPSCDAGQSCQDFDPPACRSTGTTPIGSRCDLINGSCAAGATCIGVEGSADFYCQPYCDLSPTAAGPNACSVLCPNYFFDFQTFGVCVPPLP